MKNCSHEIHQNKEARFLESFVNIVTLNRWGVSRNRGIPKSSILISRFSIIKPSISGYPYFWKHPYACFYELVESVRWSTSFQKNQNASFPTVPKSSLPATVTKNTYSLERVIYIYILFLGFSGKSILDIQIPHRSPALGNRICNSPNPPQCALLWTSCWRPLPLLLLLACVFFPGEVLMDCTHGFGEWIRTKEECHRSVHLNSKDC